MTGSGPSRSPGSTQRCGAVLGFLSQHLPAQTLLLQGRSDTGTWQPTAVSTVASLSDASSRGCTSPCLHLCTHFLTLRCYKRASPAACRAALSSEDAGGEQEDGTVPDLSVSCPADARRVTQGHLHLACASQAVRKPCTK